MDGTENRVITISDYAIVEEAAAILGYTIQHIRYLCREGYFPGSVKRGRDWLIPIEDIRSYKPGPKGFAAMKARRGNPPPPDRGQGETANV